MKKDKKNNFQDLIDIWSLIIEGKRCFWSNEQDILSVLKCISLEIEELKEAIRSYDHEEIISEIGDIIGLSIMLCFLAQRDGICSISSIIEDQCNKIKRRAPYIFDFSSDKKISSLKEAEKQWIEAKKTEKKNKRVKSCEEKLLKKLKCILNKNNKTSF